MPPGIRKLYYSIREVSEHTGLEPHVLRYWETQFEMLKPKKNRAGHRNYMQKDLDLVERIHDLTKRDKYTIEGARQILEREEREGAAFSSARRDLESLRDFLVELRDALPEGSA